MHVPELEARGGREAHPHGVDARAHQPDPPPPHERDPAEEDLAALRAANRAADQAEHDRASSHRTGILAAASDAV
jgi:hypothetical protein